MNAINKQAEKTFMSILNLLSGNDHAKIDNKPGAYMPVVVEKLHATKHGTVYSLAHYYEQNGDLMADPDMEFLYAQGKFYPLSFRQDSLGINCRAVYFDREDRMSITGKQRELAVFAGQWLRNIKTQLGAQNQRVDARYSRSAQPGGGRSHGRGHGRIVRA